MTPNNQIDSALLYRYLDDQDQLNPSERAQIEQWLQQSPQNQADLESLRILWKQSRQARLFDQVEAEADWPKVWATMQGRDKPSQTRVLPLYRQRGWQVAASVVLLIVSIWLILDLRPNSPSPIANHTVVAHDSTLTVELPDGSQVFLNESAQLSYSDDFGKQNRTVHLTGEGYFEVISDPEVPFYVHTSPTTVRVVGTSFNINSLDQAVKVTVNSGKVAFSYRSDTLLLTPNEVGVYQQGEPLQESINSDQNYLSWKTGVLRFDDVRLPQIAEDLARHYHVPIQINDEALQHLRFTSVFQNQSLDTVLEEISIVLDIRYAYEDNQVIFFITNP